MQFLLLHLGNRESGVKCYFRDTISALARSQKNFHVGTLSTTGIILLLFECSKTPKELTLKCEILLLI